MSVNTNKHVVGCNYWASNLGIYMWKKYDKEVIEKDMKLLSSHGVNCIRIFPLWPDFQPLTEIRFVNKGADLRMPFKIRTGDKPLNFQKFKDSGLDEGQVENFKHLLATADKYGISVIIAFVTGWMSGRKLVPDPFISRDLIGDAEVVLYECAFIKDLIGEIKDFKNILAYEPGNETNCLSYEIDQFQAEMWMKSITDTIRLADPTKPIYAGMHGTECKGKWNLISQAKYFDMLTPHPYPCFTPNCSLEKLTAMRASLHATCEMSYYRSIGRKPAMVQEIGCMGPMFLTDDGVPEYFEKAMMTSYAAGSTGFLWWCGFDQDHLDFAPYDVNACESYLGLAKVDHTAKPVLKKLAELRKATDEIGDLPDPICDACVIITQNVEPWDMAYGSYMMGVQAGRYLDFMFEGQEFKDYDYYILPGLCDLHGLNKYQSKQLLEKVKNGAKLLVTMDRGAMFDVEEFLGFKIFGFQRICGVKNFKVNGKDLSLAHNCEHDIRLTTAKALATDDNGKIVMTENKVGKGSVIFVDGPLETDYVKMNYPTDTNLSEIYKLFFADKEKLIDIDSNYVFLTTYDLGNGKIGAMVYNYDESKTLSIKLANGYKVTKSIYCKVDDGKLTFDRNYVYFEMQK